MLEHKSDFGKLDLEFLQQIIDATKEVVIKRIHKTSLSNFTISSIAICSRLYYYYFMNDCLTEERKIAKFNSINLNESANVIADITYEIINQRNKTLSSGINAFSELSFTIEATLVFYINLIEPFSKTNPYESLMPDMFLKVFRQALGLLRMLNLDLASEGYSNWRTLHEAECVIKLLVEGGEPLQKVYLRHIDYNSAFRNGLSSKEETDKIFVEIKANMAKHGLKSKDMKKYIEYGFLYACKTYDESNVDYKLNFRNGLQKAARLEEYNSWYEMASEMAHSSPIFFYSNTAFFADLTAVNLTDITLRLINYFEEYLKSNTKISYHGKELEKDMLIKNLEAQTKLGDDKFYTKYKDYLNDEE